jgi:hypothetical protein
MRTGTLYESTGAAGKMAGRSEPKLNMAAKFRGDSPVLKFTEIGSVVTEVKHVNRRITSSLSVHFMCF